MHTPDRDTGPLEGAAAGSWSLGIVEQSQGEGCCLLWRDRWRGCEGGDWWEMQVEENQAAMEERLYCWVTCRGWSHHHSLYPPTGQHPQLNNIGAGPSIAWHPEPQSRNPACGPLYVPDPLNNREGPQAREPSKCLNGWSYGEKTAKEAFWSSATRGSRKDSIGP